MDKRKKEYASPRVTTKSSQEILEVLGPAVAIYGPGPNEGFDPPA